jgi:hypothetical protein
MCQASAGATVKDHPKPASKISRSHVQDRVTPERQRLGFPRFDGQIHYAASTVPSFPLPRAS